MISAPAILFSILLAGWAHMTTGAGDFELAFDSLLARLSSLPDFENLLPFKFKDTVIRDLMETSKDFKKLYVKRDSELAHSGDIEREYSPIEALTQTIAKTFKGYHKKAKKSGDMLHEIQEIDPLGLVVYLTEQHKSSVKMNESIAEFRITMYDRLKLLNCIEDLSFIEVFPTNEDGVLHPIPDKIRRETASENTDQSDEYLTYFIDIVKKEKPDFHMYYDYDMQFKNFTAFESDDPNASDIQILYGGALVEGNIGHWKCIHYTADTRKVHVYDSLYSTAVDKTQQEILHGLYPLMDADIDFVEPKHLQRGVTACGIHAIFYATTILLGKDPKEIEPKINTIRGDHSLYMRLHVLKMFANRKLALFE